MIHIVRVVQGKLQITVCYIFIHNAAILLLSYQVKHSVKEACVFNVHESNYLYFFSCRLSIVNRSL